MYNNFDNGYIFPLFNCVAFELKFCPKINISFKLKRLTNSAINDKKMLNTKKHRMKTYLKLL